ncbi:ABC transporter permease [Caproicibacter sp.]|uniref:ABC transporter permease n=1 Tax=Caproicibacter sp. TaxID=2814884 RepID=UPI0039895A35
MEAFKNPFSLHLNAEDFLPAADEEKQQLIIMRESTTFWKDAWRRLTHNKVAMAAFVVIIIAILFAFVAPSFYPYTYDQQIRGSEFLHPMQYSAKELKAIAAGQSVFPHVLGTDMHGRDMVIRLMMGTRISLLVGIIASMLVLLIGTVYGAISGFFGGVVDLVMMRIVDVIYSIPDMLTIILLQVTLKAPLTNLFDTHPSLGWLQAMGVPMVSIFLTFSLLYWTNMARIIRGQIMALKEQEFVTAAHALGASSSRIIMKHLIPNCISVLIVTATLEIPRAIFTEAFLSFLGLGVMNPMASLGSLASDAIGGMESYTYLLVAPAVAISLVILSFNLFGDGLRDAFDPKLKENK